MLGRMGKGGGGSLMELDIKGGKSTIFISQGLFSFPSSFFCLFFFLVAGFAGQLDECGR